MTRIVLLLCLTAVACGPVDPEEDPGQVGGGGGPMCTPSCAGRECGSNGCGGTCAPGCAANEACSASGQCQCVPSCAGKQCGPDGCGGNCGPGCGPNETCGTGGQCACVPSCEGKACGDDGCGGTCGQCPANSTCNSSQTSCGCDAGYVPDKTFTSCLALGGPCSGVNSIGYCSGDTWVRCDAEEGLLAMSCGNGGCNTIDAAGNGACSCGPVDNQGFCATPYLETGKDVHFWCAPLSDIIVAYNCAGVTGRTAAFCSHFVTPFGSATGCYCGPCSAWNSRLQVCEPACPYGGRCVYDVWANAHTCL